MYVCMYVYVYMQTQARTHTCLCDCVCTYIYIHMICRCMYVYIYIYCTIYSLCMVGSMGALCTVAASRSLIQISRRQVMSVTRRAQSSQAKVCARVCMCWCLYKFIHIQRSRKSPQFRELPDTQKQEHVGTRLQYQLCSFKLLICIPYIWLFKITRRPLTQLRRCRRTPVCLARFWRRRPADCRSPRRPALGFSGFGSRAAVLWC